MGSRDSVLQQICHFPITEESLFGPEQCEFELDEEAKSLVLALLTRDRKKRLHGAERYVP